MVKIQVYAGTLLSVRVRRDTPKGTGDADCLGNRQDGRGEKGHMGRTINGDARAGVDNI